MYLFVLKTVFICSFIDCIDSDSVLRPNVDIFEVIVHSIILDILFCLCLIFRNASDFGMPFLYLANLLNSPSNSLFLECLSFYICNHSIL